MCCASRANGTPIARPLSLPPEFERDAIVRPRRRDGHRRRRRFEAGARGGIGILVNNAGWDRMMNFVDTDPTFWRKVIDINLVGHLNLHHAVLPRMVARRSGSIINIASDAGRVGSSGEAVR